MRFREGLQVRLQERYRRLYKSDWKLFTTNVTVFMDWLQSVPVLASMIATIERSNPELDVDAWWDEVTGTRNPPWWPETEEERGKIVICFLRSVAYESGFDWTSPLHRLTDERSYGDGARAFCDQWIEPVVEYLQERLSSESDMLYLLERYRRRVEWFEQERLYGNYTTDTAHGEANYDNDLRKFLFSQGVDYPYSQPEGPSGKPDVVANADTDDPLTCEIKLFDGESRGIAYLAKGVAQAVRYAEDYGKTAAHLVIYNLTDNTLQLPDDDPDAGWPPRIEVGGVTVFLVAVQALPREKASKAGKTKAVAIGRSDLVDGG